MSWLSGWNYRKSITLSRASGAVSNYQMKLLVGESAGASGEDVDCNNHALPTFEDLRFTKSDGQTLLDYWIDSVIGNEPDRLATIWIEFDLIETDPINFYMYYGIASRASHSMNAFCSFVCPDGTIWAGHMSDGTVRKSTDGGQSWTTKYTFAVGSLYVMCVWQASNGYLFASRYNGGILVRSVDGGETWSTCLTLLGDSDSMVWRMAEDSDGYIYVGENGTGVEVSHAYIFRSADDGDNWTTIWNAPDPSPARHIHFVAVDPYTDILYASQGDTTGGKLLKSINHGDSWTTIGSGSSLWHPTSIAFGEGFRLIGCDNIDNPPVCIRKTTDDVNFIDVYTPPWSDDLVYWNGGSVDNNGLIVFGSWTQADNERATLIGTKDGGTTWVVFDVESTGIGNRGFTSVSNVSPSGILYAPRSIEGDLVGYMLNYPSEFPDSLPDIIDTMIKGDDGVEGNFTEATNGTGALSHTNGKYAISMNSTDDAAIAGAILSDWFFESWIKSFGIFTGDASILNFGLVDVAAVANLIGDSTKVPLWRFLIGRYNSTHPSYPNYLQIMYRGTDDIFYYWTGTQWTTTATRLNLSSGTVQLKIWSDGANFYADILDASGVSLLTAQAQIAISSIKAFSNGKCLHWGEARTDAYYVNQSIDNYFIRQYLDPEPTWGSWGEEEGGTPPSGGTSFVAWIN